MKKILLYIIGILTGGFVWSACSSEENLTELEQGNNMNFTLQINSGELQSRATITESENSIQTLDIYLYPNGGESENALFYYSHVLNTIVTDGSETVTVNIPGTIVNSLFPNNATTCTAYVIANKGTVTLPEDNTSMSSLKGTILNEADFTKQQDLFVMDGSNTVSYNTTDRTILGTVDLYRAASKISLIVTGVENVVEDDFGNKWQSDPTNQVMKVGFYNGVKKATINVNAVPYEIEDEDYFNIASNLGRVLSSFNVTNDDSSTSTHYTHELPFYSYSSEWTSGDPTAPYLIVVVPWQKLDQNGKPDGDYIPCYYQIPINETNKKLERNHYYEIKLNIGILGSFTPDEPLLIDDATYVVLNWSEAPTNATLKEYRYLVVDKNFVEMDNVEDIKISFSTSHEVEIVNATLTKPVLNPLNAPSATIATTSYTLTTQIENGGDNIYFKHELDNEWSSTDKSYDYVPYTLELDIRHKDNYNFIEHVIIVQYPAMFVVANLNSNYKSSTSSQNNSNKGYVKVNNSTSSFGNVTGLGSAENANPNMYTITTTALPSESNYIIGDPRSTTIDNYLDGTNNNWSVNAPTLPASTQNRGLSYYYPTTESESKKNVISPKFRIASSYGVTSSIGFETAKKRCASYQEDGYPAGRWRIPTYSEVEYIVKLSAEQKIPKLFNDGGNYWAANETICVPKHANGGSVSIGSGTSAYVRCVYDEWYWTDKCDKNTFTWGDKEITW